MIEIVQLGVEIPRWKIIDGKKFWFDRAFSTKSKAKVFAKATRKSGFYARIITHKKPFVFSGSNKKCKYSVWINKK